MKEIFKYTILYPLAILWINSINLKIKNKSYKNHKK